MATICATADLIPSTMEAVVPIVVVKPPATICGITPMYWVVVVPESHVVSHHHSAHRVHQVLGLQIRKLLLLVAQLDVEQVVVDLRNNRLQRHAPLHARRTHHSGN